MSSALFTLPELYRSYKNWVSQNPQVVGDFESLAKWISYFIAGRINSSHVLSELVFSLSNLLVLYNDHIISSSRRLRSVGSGDRLKTWLTVVEYSEVFIEISAKRLWGDKGKWIIVVILQLFKCIGRLKLLFHHKENMVQNPPIPPLQRKKIRDENDPQSEEARIRFNNASFTLKRSGRIVRSVSAAPPPSCRTWRPLKPPNNNVEDDVEDVELDRQSLYAEVMYIIKPVLHLCSMSLHGQKDWKPWLLSLIMDLASIQMYYAQSKQMSRRQQLELSRRTIGLLLYLIRSPFYEHHSRDRLQALLYSMSANLPLVRIICKPIAQYLPQWQDTYFYMWSS
ncbi:hypothetical protein L9F63_000809 [Diploptera punctata]|uniref:Peroxisomal membrane protein PEX16 n=1 Tax=Diploptera punctata TaxID=6984 RepID=A0AAD8AKY8_DIPPU|nr:hypothetical protein L9F63_000809 [Diploptera punctata]